MNKEYKSITKKDFEFLTNYLNSPSPTGNEKANQELWSKYVKSVDKSVKINSDPYYNYWASYGKGKKTVVIEAHADEIAWAVNTILPSGKLNVIRQGGSDVMIAPSQKVRVFGNKGELTGFFSFPAIHVRKSDAFKVELESLEVDCGFSSKEEAIEAGVEVGTQLIFDSNCYFLNEKWLVGRALDNRIGGFMIAKVLHLLVKNKINLNYKLVLANCSQEEIGLYGAHRFVDTIKNEENVVAAIVTDVTHDSNEKHHNSLKEGYSICGEGPVVAVGPLIQKDLLNTIRDAANKSSMKYQLNVTDRWTGTDTDKFSLASIPSALISLPLRNMHTTNEMISLSDLEDTIMLIYNSLLEINNSL